LKAIETVYAGTTFRSRLEATWACMFDMLGWTWAHEPFDLDGYIPDFVLGFYKDVLVEVKPATSEDDLKLQAVAKIVASGWDKEALIVGVLPLYMDEDSIFPGHRRLGVLGQVIPETDTLSWGWGLAHGCTECGRFSMYHDFMTFNCRVTGCYAGDHFLGGPEPDLAAMWGEAQRIVRWEPGKRAKVSKARRDLFPSIRRVK